MKLDLTNLGDCHWQWDEHQQLLRNAPNLEDLEIEANEGVEIWGVPYVQGGGQCLFTLVYDTTGPDEPILIETRDIWKDDVGTEFPIWENARIVPEANRFYQPVRRILNLV